MSDPVPPPVLTGLSRIAARYDAVICDVWGVVHNGRVPFAGTVEALRHFRAARGPVVLLTNAPRMAADVRVQLARIGVPDDCFDALVTSGEATRADLARRAAGPDRLPVFILGPERDRATHQGLHIRSAGIEEAALVLCTGLFDDEHETPDDYRDMLARLRARDLTMLCANPDVTVRRGDTVVYCAGAIARAYEAIGGCVVYFGKPHKPVFDVAHAAARALGPAVRPLVIGDGLETDIKGANGMGWDCVLIVGGLLGAEFGTLPAAEAQARLGERLTRSGVHVTAVMQELFW